MKQFIYLFALTIILTGCSSDDDSNSNNSDPSSFSANTIDIRMDGATIEWTEAIDPDGDALTYAIILDGQEIASGGTTLIYSFSGLEPDTSYEGYVEARDGKGGVSTANFFFTTEPQVMEFNVDASFWERADRLDLENGQRVFLGAGFRVPYFEDATQYQIEIIEYVFDGSSSNVDQTYIWTNDSHGDPIEFYNDWNPQEFGVVFNFANVGCPGSICDDFFGTYQNVVGVAEVTVTFGNQ